MLRRSPGFTLIAVLTLGLGIGANTGIFSVLDAVLLKPLPFAHADRLIWGWGNFPLSDKAAISSPDFLEYRDRNRSFDELAASQVVDGMSNLAGGIQPEQVTTALVSANFFDVLNIRPLFGRGFTRADEKVAYPQAVILGHAFWQQRFGGDRSIVGKRLALGGDTVTVAGVLSSDIPLLSAAQVWIPMPLLNPGMTNRRGHFLRLIGRLRPGVTIQKAQADMDSVARDLSQRYPLTNADWNVRLEPLRDVKVGPVRSTLWILLGAVGVVLLIACSNVANLLLARGAVRQREVAIRIALGAKRGRLIRQFLTESLLLALAGGLLAVLLSSWGVDALRTFGPADLPRLNEVQLDGAVLAFAALISVLTGVAFGLAPALRSTRGDLQPALKDGTRGSSAGARSQRLGGLLIVSEVALSLVLLVSAGLLIKSFWRLVHVNPGFRMDHLVTTQVQLPAKTYGDQKHRIFFFEELAERVAALPGVESARMISELPLTNQPNDQMFQVQGRGYLPNQKDDANYRRVAGGYFRAMSIPLMRGRAFSTQDTANARHVVVVNEPFVRHYFPQGDPLGQRLVIGDGADAEVLEVVGVVGGVRHDSLQSPPRPEMYVPFSQDPSSSMNIVVRTAGDPAYLASALRGVVTALDADEATSAIRAMDDLIATSLAQPRFSALLLGLFAMIALLLAAVGLYGVISYAASQRTREIGVRMALGAEPRDILRLVVGQGLRMTALGLAIGLAGAFAVTRFLSGLLFDVTPLDAASFAGLPLLLAAIAMAACWIPARRAARVDPLISLRDE